MSLAYRMDNRTRDAFKTDIEQFTEKEFYWGIALRYDFCERGMPCQLEEHGVDNTGRLIEGRLPNRNVDKKYVFEDDLPPAYIEIKTIPEWSPWFTFKVESLENCLDHDAQIVVPRLHKYHMFDRTGIEHFLAKFKPQKIEKFGDKLCIRVRPDVIHDMVAGGMTTDTPWLPKAKAYIEDMKAILFAERKTTHG